MIGILGEYDALPGLEQEAVPAKKPLRATKLAELVQHSGPAVSGAANSRTEGADPVSPPAAPEGHGLG